MGRLFIFSYLSTFGTIISYDVEIVAVVRPFLYQDFGNTSYFFIYITFHPLIIFQFYTMTIGAGETWILSWLSSFLYCLWGK